MTKRPGYVYVLINPSAKGLVKIGKTTKDPDERAKELSSATGVPTPFIVVYNAFFQDCAAAETFIHALLDDKRLTNSKEFFRASPTEAVKAVLETEKFFNDADERNDHDAVAVNEDENLSSNSEKINEAWVDIFLAAEDYYLGNGDKLQDYQKALQLFKQAAKLGCKQAYYKIGEMYYTGFGIGKDIQQALSYFSEGASQGDVKCWGDMAICYCDLKQYGNSDKCWYKLFTSPSMQGKENEMGYYFYNFYNYMKSTRWWSHPEVLESFYQNLRSGMEK